MIKFTQEFIDSLKTNEAGSVNLEENMTLEEYENTLHSPNNEVGVESIVIFAQQITPRILGQYATLCNYRLHCGYCSIVKKNVINTAMGSKCKTDHALNRIHINLTKLDIVHIYRLPNDYIAYFFIHATDYDPQVEEEFSQLKGVKKVRVKEEETTPITMSDIFEL